MNKGCKKILRLIFGTFLEVGQPIPNIENLFTCQRSIKTFSMPTKYYEVFTFLRLSLRQFKKVQIASTTPLIYNLYTPLYTYVDYKACPHEYFVKILAILEMHPLRR
jgi:hypothetical protein